MKWTLAILLIAASKAGASLPTGPLGWQKSFEKPVRVRLAHDLGHLVIEGYGLVLQGREGPYIPVSLPRVGHLDILRVETPRGPMWKINRSGPGGDHTELRSEAVLVIEGLDLRRGGASLPNRLVLHAKSNQFDLIGVVPLEEYLVGVVSGEMPLTWPLEALKAQVVAARSYTLAVMAQRQKLHYDLESSILDQVFRQVAVEHDKDRSTLKAKRAVEETRGVVLLDQRGRIVKAYYHADCGGATSPAKIVWSAGDESPVVTDSYCKTHGHSEWSYALTANELRERLSHQVQIASEIEQITPIAARGNERATDIKLALADGAEQIINAHMFRAAVGYSNLRSTLFQVSRVGDEFQFEGRGWGHGVGLCQQGTRRLAMLGQEASQILAHYYPLNRLSADLKRDIALRRTTQQE